MLPPDQWQGNSGYQQGFTNSPVMSRFFRIMTRLVKYLAIVLLALLAWFFWQQPAVMPVEKTAHTLLPAIEGQVADQWRVVTRRMVTDAAVTALTDRLRALGLTPVTLNSREEVTLHAFDDAIIYDTRSAADLAAQRWKDKGMAVNIIEVSDTVYLIGLGRLYQDENAGLLQQELQKSGMPYRYQRRNVMLPAWRFTFSPLAHGDAQQLWKQLADSGVAMPVLMPESRFQLLYGALLHKPTAD